MTVQNTGTTEPGKPGADLTLQSWRKRMGYTLEEAATHLGLPRAALEQYETGKAVLPRYLGLACAALALGMSPYKDD